MNANSRVALRVIIAMPIHDVSISWVHTHASVFLVITELTNLIALNWMSAQLVNIHAQSMQRVLIPLAVIIAYAKTDILAMVTHANVSK